MAAMGRPRNSCVLRPQAIHQSRRPRANTAGQTLGEISAIVPLVDVRDWIRSGVSLQVAHKKQTRMESAAQTVLV